MWKVKRTMSLMVTMNDKVSWRHLLREYCPAELNALLPILGFSGAGTTWPKRLPPIPLGFFAFASHPLPSFRDFSPTTNFPGGALAMVNSVSLFT
jgi:hypothetical protein